MRVPSEKRRRSGPSSFHDQRPRDESEDSLVGAWKAEAILDTSPASKVISKVKLPRSNKKAPRYSPVPIIYFHRGLERSEGAREREDTSRPRRRLAKSIAIPRMKSRVSFRADALHAPIALWSNEVTPPIFLYRLLFSFRRALERNSRGMRIDGSFFPSDQTREGDKGDRSSIEPRVWRSERNVRVRRHTLSDRFQRRGCSYYVNWCFAWCVTAMHAGDTERQLIAKHRAAVVL